MAPPPVSNDVKGAVRDAAGAGVSTSTSAKTGTGTGTGVHASGQEPGMQPDSRVKVEKPGEES